jgi:hypothetical protein
VRPPPRTQAMAAERGRRSLVAIGMPLGLFLLIVGVVLLTTWEVELFRASTFGHDFSGLVCGVPLDNPGWETGSPCHGALNRQAGVGVMLTANGLVMTIAAAAISVGLVRGNHS